MRSFRNQMTETTWNKVRIKSERRSKKSSETIHKLIFVSIENENNNKWKIANVFALIDWFCSSLFLRQKFNLSQIQFQTLTMKHSETKLFSHLTYFAVQETPLPICHHQIVWLTEHLNWLSLDDESIRSTEDEKKKTRKIIISISSMCFRVSSNGSFFSFDFVQESSGVVSSGPPSTGASHHMPPPGTIQRPAHAKEYHFLDIELKYGILQVSATNCHPSKHRLRLFSQRLRFVVNYVFAPSSQTWI